MYLDMRPTATHPQTPTKGEPAQRDTDLDAIKKELENIKKKLAEQEVAQIRSTTSSQKSAL